MKVEHHQKEKLPTRSPFSLCCGMFLFTLTSLFYSSFFFHLSRFFWKRAIHFSFKSRFIWFTKKLFHEIVQSAGVFSFLKFRKGKLKMFIFQAKHDSGFGLTFCEHCKVHQKGKKRSRVEFNSFVSVSKKHIVARNFKPQRENSSWFNVTLNSVILSWLNLTLETVILSWFNLTLNTVILSLLNVRLKTVILSWLIVTLKTVILSRLNVTLNMVILSWVDLTLRTAILTLQILTTTICILDQT